MKLPLSIGPVRADKKNGGEFVVVKDAEGAWIGDVRAEHIGALLAATSSARSETGAMEFADNTATKAIVSASTP